MNPADDLFAMLAQGSLYQKHKQRFSRNSLEEFNEEMFND